MSIDNVSDISTKVPREAVIVYFGGILAVSPEIMTRMLEEFAEEYNVSVLELGPYVFHVLRSLPCDLD